MNNRVRLSADQRRSMILQTAVAVANDVGIDMMTYTNVAAGCEFTTSPRTVEHYYPIQMLRLKVAQHEGSTDVVKRAAKRAGFIA